ncbi:hypothetical protein QL285_010216 [Trifolium repens]|nr:hypothetical protein QL285_010216 [Trifolium repens]
MPPKLPPKTRKFDSRCEKRKKKKRSDELTQSQKGALNKFIIREPQIPIENQNVDVGILENMVCTENMVEDINVNATENDKLEAQNTEENANVNATENDNLDAGNVDNSNDNGENIDIFDPTIWESLESKMIDLLAAKGPKRDLSIVKGPKDKTSRRFTANLYTRVLSNGEKCDRDWLVHSKELDSILFLL